MFPVILPFFRTPFCSLHCQQFLHFSPHVLYTFLHSFLRTCSEQSHLIFHVFTFCHVSPCNFLFLLQRTPQRIIRNINLHMPYLFFHLLQTEFQPFLALSPAKVFPWPALWLVFGQLEAVHTTWQPQSPPGSCRLDHHLLRLVTAGLLSEFLMSQSAGPV